MLQPYIALLRHNQPFRRLWYGQIVSQLGDWLDSVALFTLLLALTGSGQALGLLLVAEFLPGALIGPFAGVIVDRLPRKLVLIASDIGRALLVLAFLLVQSPDQIWIIYVALIGKVALSAFFEPARSAIIPSLVSREELVAANAISSATWSLMLAVGAGLGGLIAGLLGTSAAFLLDSATFLLSALLIAGVAVPAAQAEARPAAAASFGGAARRFGSELREGLRYLASEGQVAWFAFAKALWSIGAGVLLLLTLYGREIFPLGRDGALSIGLFYAARGVGTGLGPIIAQALGGNSSQFLRRAMAGAFFLTAFGYLLLSQANWLWFGLLAVLLAHMGGSIQWVFSTALLQMAVPDRLRGRVFAVEYAALMLTTAASNYLAGLASDAGFSPSQLAVILGCLFIPPGIAISLAVWRAPQHADEPVEQVL